jgi:hypothetical protein
MLVPYRARGGQTMPSGLDLREDGDDFILDVTARDGTTTQVKLTSEQLLTLAQSAPKFRERILSRRSPTTAGIQPVLATTVVQVGLNQDALGQDLLLSLVAPTGTQLTYALPIQIVELLVERLPQWLDKMRRLKTTKQ